MNEKIHTVVMVFRRGGDFRFFDAILLAHHIRKHWKGDDLRIICLTDTTDEPLQGAGMTILPLPNQTWHGWWSKMNLFSPAMEQYRPFLYLDLDTAVLGDLRHYFNEEYIDTFLTLKDFYTPLKLATGVMLLPTNNNKLEAIWNAWFKDPKRNMIDFRGDQEFIRIITTADYFFQDIMKGIYTFKPKDGRLVNVPDDAKIVCFHGKPRPYEAAKKVQWVKTYMDEL